MSCCHKTICIHIYWSHIFLHSNGKTPQVKLNKKMATPTLKPPQKYFKNICILLWWLVYEAEVHEK